MSVGGLEFAQATGGGGGARWRGRSVRALWAACALLALACLGLVITVILLSVAAGPSAGRAEKVQGGMKDAVAEESPKGGAAEAAAALPRGPWEESFRLSPDAYPQHYDLTLWPDLAAGTFSGDVVITVNVSRPLPFIAVHTKRLEVLATNVTRVESSEGGGESAVAVPLAAAFEYPPHELWVLQPQDGDDFPAATYRLHFAFKGTLLGKIVGFYRSKYKDDASAERAIATSKFQPTYARQAFPCFDEPSFKSKFTIQLVRPSGDGYSALSNMNVVKEVADKPSQGLTTVYFNESVPMVTYLACFIVSDFQSLPPLTVKPGNIPFKVYSTPAQVNKTQYALETGAAIAEYYIKFFDIDYPLPKLDMIAIPDFVSGAMEHWGLITFRETNLLFDPTISSATNQQRVASVIAHELAHMWFGNLMTLKWWDDLWLNEGFASYIQYRGTNSRHPDWAMMDQFLIEQLHPVLDLDAALSSHPIVQQVRHPDEITELFDTISYNKGSAVIRMLEGFMGEESFRMGISSFLKKFAYKNAVTKDLWDTLQQAIDKGSLRGEKINIQRVMDTWTRQMGYPVLTVVMDEAGNRVITQQRFLADPEAEVSEESSPFGYRWEVPITFVTSESKTVESVWLSPDNTNVIISGAGGVKWIKLNHHQVGYYRVNYTEWEWQTFSSLLQGNYAALDPSDRANLLDDSFSLADACLLRYEIALELTQYLQNETEYVPWATAFSELKRIKAFLSGSNAYPKLRTYAQGLVRNIYKSLTWTVSPEDSHLKRRLRARVLDFACDMGLEECLDAAGQEFTKWIQNPSQRPHPDIRSLVYSYGMKRAGTEKTWDIMWDLFLKETDAQEKSKLMSGLSEIHEPWILQRFIELAKDEKNVRSQDFFSALSMISSNPVGNPIVWDFIRSEWEYLVDRFTLNDRYLGRLIPVVTKRFATPFKKEEMITFFERYPDAGAGKAARNRALETAANNIRWVQNHKDTIGNWLSHQPLIK